MYSLEFRRKVVRNTDPLGRCYDGCHFSSTEEWTDWLELFQYSKRAAAEDSMATFKRCNPHCEYRVQGGEECVLGN
jgi:hypothetical protein